MNLFVAEIILFALCVIFLACIAVFMAKWLLHSPLGVILFILLIAAGIACCVWVPKVIVGNIDNEFSRSEVVAEYDLLKVDYQDDYVYVTYVDEDGKIVTERNNKAKLHRQSDKNYFINIKYKRWFFYWYGWEVYINE